MPSASEGKGMIGGFSDLPCDERKLNPYLDLESRVVTYRLCTNTIPSAELTRAGSRASQKSATIQMSSLPNGGNCKLPQE
jgi:hypothetical protein